MAIFSITGETQSTADDPVRALHGFILIVGEPTARVAGSVEESSSTRRTAPKRGKGKSRR